MDDNHNQTQNPTVALSDPAPGREPQFSSQSIQKSAHLKGLIRGIPIDYSDLPLRKEEDEGGEGEENQHVTGNRGRMQESRSKETMQRRWITRSKVGAVGVPTALLLSYQFRHEHEKREMRGSSEEEFY
ncbi:hypothetical protein B296_00039560 [Ensete ventricosum]|uniref:Uncharacterized protein n=1 Tax=Ensete ventricosum TaxID=4639 RepID=A0A426ZPB3_ENSVE|nr:hypothetical protein B296_00039560 [Ensete ventricosum]